MADQVKKFEIKIESKSPKWTQRSHPDKVVVVEKGIPIPPKFKHIEHLPF